jgi:hypothetical protein
MTTTKYDSERFMVAHGRFLEAARTLTDEDIEQLACVDPKLADRARAKRAGYKPEPRSPEQVAFDKQPILNGVFLTWIRDWMDPLLGTYRLRIGEAREAIEELKKRVTELEQRPVVAYKGIWNEHQLYGAGEFVTFSGSMWIAKTACIGRRPGTDPNGWQLVVKRGADGRDGKDLRSSGQGAT